MEFFQEVTNTGLNDAELKNLLQINNLTTLCASINTILSDKGNEGVIYCIWGEFNIKREEIKHGVRFSLLTCPHALAWTVTLDKVNNKIVIHCTIDKKDEDPDFIDSIYEFVNDWADGLSKNLGSNKNLGSSKNLS